MPAKTLVPDNRAQDRELECTLDIESEAESEAEPKVGWLQNFIESSQLQRILIGFVFVYIAIALLDMSLSKPSATY